MAEPKVLIVIASANRRGAEVEGVELARQLQLLGLDARVVSLAPSSGGPGLAVDVLGAAPLGLATLRALRRRAKDVDVVIAYGSTTLPACAIALIGSRRPFVYRSIGDPRRWSKGGLHRVRTALLFRRARAVVALWPEAAAAIVDLYRVRADRVSVIPNARDGQHFRPASSLERAAARQELGVPPEATAIGFVGALSSEKRPLLAIEAAMLVDGAHLLMAGDGPMREHVRSAAEATNGRVHTLGSLDDVRPVLWACDVLLSTSSTEGMPGSLIEARMCGIPIVATRVGAVPLVLDGIAGAMVPVDATPAEFSKHLQRGDTLGLHSDSGEFDWERVGRAWHRLICSIA